MSRRATIAAETFFKEDEVLKNVYEPFFRGSNAEKVRGYGFGLPLAFKIIKIPQGSIQINSEVDKGTEVIINLPIVRRATHNQNLQF